MPKRHRKSTRRKQKRRNKTQRKKGGIPGFYTTTTTTTWAVKPIDWEDLDKAYVDYETPVIVKGDYVTSHFKTLDIVEGFTDFSNYFNTAYTALSNALPNGLGGGTNIVFDEGESPPITIEKTHIVSAFLIAYMIQHPYALLNDDMLKSNTTLSSVMSAFSKPLTSIMDTVSGIMKDDKIHSDVLNFLTKNKLRNIFRKPTLTATTITALDMQYSKGIPFYTDIFKKLLSGLYASKTAAVSKFFSPLMGEDMDKDMKKYFKPEALGINP